MEYPNISQLDIIIVDINQNHPILIILDWILLVHIVDINHNPVTSEWNIPDPYVRTEPPSQGTSRRQPALKALRIVRPAPQALSCLGTGTGPGDPTEFSVFFQTQRLGAKKNIVKGRVYHCRRRNWRKSIFCSGVSTDHCLGWGYHVEYQFMKPSHKQFIWD